MNVVDKIYFNPWNVFQKCFRDEEKVKAIVESLTKAKIVFDRIKAIETKKSINQTKEKGSINSGKRSPTSTAVSSPARKKINLKNQLKEAKNTFEKEKEQLKTDLLNFSATISIDETDKRDEEVSLVLKEVNTSKESMNSSIQQSLNTIFKTILFYSNDISQTNKITCEEIEKTINRIKSYKEKGLLDNENSNLFEVVIKEKERFDKFITPTTDYLDTKEVKEISFNNAVIKNMFEHEYTFTFYTEDNFRKCIIKKDQSEEKVFEFLISKRHDEHYFRVFHNGKELSWCLQPYQKNPLFKHIGILCQSLCAHLKKI